MAIDDETVRNVAKLARLELEEHEVKSLKGHLTQMLEYAQLLDELDTRNVPETAHAAVSNAPLRSDEVKPSLPLEATLEQAPRHTDRGFAVPAFVDEG